MQKEFNNQLGALLPEDMVYEILEFSGHGNWRAGRLRERFVYRLRFDDPRFEVIGKIQPIQKMKFFVDMNYGNGFNVATYDYYIQLKIPGEYNKYYELATAEFQGGPTNLIKYTINLITDKMATRNIYSEHVYYDPL